MTTVLQYLVIAAVVGLLLFGVALLLFGRGERLAALPARTSPARLPERGIAGSDVRQVRFALAVRGYRMSDVDWTLERLADELDRTRHQLALLTDIPDDTDRADSPDSPDRADATGTEQTGADPTDTDRTGADPTGFATTSADHPGTVAGTGVRSFETGVRSSGAVQPGPSAPHTPPPAAPEVTAGAADARGARAAGGPTGFGPSTDEAADAAGRITAAPTGDSSSTPSLATSGSVPPDGSADVDPDDSGQPGPAAPTDRSGRPTPSPGTEV